MIKKLAAPFLGFFVFFITLTGLLWVYEYSSHSPKSPSEIRFERGGERSFKRSPGARPLPFEASLNGGSNGKLRIIKKRNGEISSDKSYVLDAHSLRIVSGHGDGTNHAIFAGCSYIFGQGLDDEETFPYLFEIKSHQYNAYNFGFLGGNLGQILFHLEKIKISSFVKEAEGVLIYNLIQGHLNRWYLRPDYLHWASRSKPVYELEGGKVQFKGFLSDQWKFKAYRFLRSIGLEHTALKISALIEDKDSFTVDDIEEYVLAIKHLEQTYKSYFPKGEFVVLIHPQGNFSRTNKEVFTRAFNKNRIKYLDPISEYESYQKQYHLKYQDMHIPLDGHPSGKTNEFLAGFLKDKI